MFRSKTNKITVTGVLIALGVLIPSMFHLFGQLGSIFLPMHIPVLLCGLLCGAPYGAICGVVVPLLSSIISGMPPIYPVGLSMMVELATYGLVSGICYPKMKKIYPALITAMLAGRVVYGIFNTILYGVAGNGYSFAAFVSGAFVTALPGIIIQLVLIPLLITALKKAAVASPLED